MSSSTDRLVLCLCGDLMTGRGVDQAFRTSVEPRLYEPYVKDARRYLELAETVNGPLPRPVEPAYVWGEALEELERARPDVRIANLETAVTTAHQPCEGKGIHYRMHPANVECLRAAKLDVCALANNHVLDWGPAGLEETLRTLQAAGIRAAGAGRDVERATRPAVVQAAGGATFVFSVGSAASGIPPAWAAGPRRPGVWRLPDLSDAAVEPLLRRLRRERERLEEGRSDRPLVLLSIHWGGNWGYRIPAAQRKLARRLIDEAGVDVVHGHSSHHPLGIEVHAGRLVLYGCGDLISDYEGISGRAEYRPELVLLYLVSLEPADGRLTSLRMIPLRIRRVRLERAAPEEARWLRHVLDRESRPLGAGVEMGEDGDLVLRWGEGS